MPMVDGVQPYSLAQAAAATLKLVRSAHNSTLPAKKTVAVTPQLIGRESRPFEPVLADMAFLPEILFVPRPLAGRRKIFDGAAQAEAVGVSITQTVGRARESIDARGPARGGIFAQAAGRAARRSALVVT